MPTKITRRISLASSFAALGHLLGQQSETSSANAHDPPDAAAEQIAAMIDDLARKGEFNGVVLVAHRGQPLYRGAFGLANREWEIPNDVETRFRVGSVTKPFTATLVLRAVEQGLLGFDTRVREYFPDKTTAAVNQVTISQLLSHTSGVIDYPDVAGFEYNGERLKHSREEMLQLFIDAPLRFPPGTDQRYSNFGYFLLGYLLERLTGKSYASLLQRQIFDPLGMKNSSAAENKQLVARRAAGYYVQDGITYNALPFDTSIVMGAGDIISTADDLLRFDQALYSDQLLSETMRRFLFIPRMPEKDNYAYGWYVRLPSRHPGPDWARHSGSINGFSSLLLRLPESRHTVVLLSNLHGVKTIPLGDEIKSILLKA